MATTQTSTNTVFQDIPEYMKNYMTGDDTGEYTGILEEAMRQYQARAGAMTDEQLAAAGMPMRSVASRTPLQTQATTLAQQGVGSYLPMLQAGANTVSSGINNLNTGFTTMQQGYNPLAAAETMVTDSVQGAIPYRDFGIQQMQNAIPDIQAAGMRGELAAAGGVRGVADAANMGVQAGQDTAQNLLGLGQQSSQVGLNALKQLPQYGQRLEQQGQMTAGDIMAAGRGLEGVSAEFDPSNINKYMNPYEQSVIDAALADVARAGQQQVGQLGASAVSSGAFGGARQGIAEAEISRNVLDQQAKTAAAMRQAGYESAGQRAQSAYDAAKNRQLQGATAGAGIAGQAGQAAMQGTQAGANIAGQATQMGLAGLGQGMQAAGQAGQAQSQGAQMGMQGAQSAAGLGMQGAQMGMGAAGQAAGLGGQVAQTGAQFGQMGLAGAGQMGALAGQYGSLGSGMANVGQGLGSMGMKQAQLGEAQQGLNLNDMSTLQNIGAQEQGQAQAVIDATYANQYDQYQQPMKELGFYSDVYQGMPIGQSTYSQSSAPGPSALSQIGGLGVGLYGMSRS